MPHFLSEYIMVQEYMNVKKNKVKFGLVGKVDANSRYTWTKEENGGMM
jgi:hypothetical protein